MGPTDACPFLHIALTMATLLYVAAKVSCPQAERGGSKCCANVSLARLLFLCPNPAQLVTGQEIALHIQLCHHGG